MDLSRRNFAETLRRLPLFTDLAESELAVIAEGMTRQSYDRGAVIFEEGDVCHELMVVEQGTVKILKSSLDGRRQLINIERRGAR